MEICKTDKEKLIRLLKVGAELIDRYCQKPCQQDKARQMRQMAKKLSRKS